MHSWPTHSAWSEVRTRTFSFFRDMAYESRLAVEVCIMIHVPTVEPPPAEMHIYRGIQLHQKGCHRAA